jgi:drug/metabolite transporter superfamily protein YnfA
MLQNKHAAEVNDMPATQFNTRMKVAEVTSALGALLSGFGLGAWLASSFHRSAVSGRVYASYGGIYVVVALAWLWKVDRVPVTIWNLTGACVCIAGMGIIVWGGWRV